jgi:ParB family chromosome partitioning protein
MLQDPAIEELLDIRSIKPASSLNKKTIQELVESIREHGLIQPIIVRPVKHGFEIVAGHRRFEACKLLRWKSIPGLEAYHRRRPLKYNL